MSKINAVRLINLNYNNNAIRISDEIFQMGGKSTLLSLRNGGGKSVLVQMMTAPFVHKQYRKTKDRPFESYFTTAKPTFIMVEWVLDHEAGYCLTGMMVRRSQAMDEQSAEPLEIINFISEYPARCEQDIYNIPVVEKGKQEIILKNFNACKQLFEDYKKERSMKFFYYDMNNSAQSRQYFDKLSEYQIYYKEWETIIKKVNLKESGLSELFSDCRDEKELLEKWFLEAIESKLNREQNRMKEFQIIIEKYIRMYRDNKSKIERRDTILEFRQDMQEVEACAQEYLEAEEDVKADENRIACFIKELQDMEDEVLDRQNEVLARQTDCEEELAHIIYEKLSAEIYLLKKNMDLRISNRDMIEMEKDALEEEISGLEKLLHILSCAKQQANVDEYAEDYRGIKERIEVAKADEKELEPERRLIGGYLKDYCQKRLQQNAALSEEKKTEHGLLEKSKEEQKQKEEECQKKIEELIERIAECRTRIRDFDRKEDIFNRNYQEQLTRNIIGDYEPGVLEIKKEQYEKQLTELIRSCSQHKKQQEEAEENKRAAERSVEDKQSERNNQNFKLQLLQRETEELEQEVRERLTIMKYLDMEETQIWNKARLLEAADRKISESDRKRKELEKEENVLQQEWKKLTSGEILELPQDFKDMLSELELHPVYGMNWLDKNGYSEEQNKKLIRKQPFLPYSLILTKQEMKKLEMHGKEIYTSFPIPIIPREALEDTLVEEETGILHLRGISFYLWFNEKLLDEDALQVLIRQKETELKQKQVQITLRKQEYQEYLAKKTILVSQFVTKEALESHRTGEKEAEEKIAALEEAINGEKEKVQMYAKLSEELQQRILQEKQDIEHFRKRELEFASFCEDYALYQKDRREMERRKQDKSRYEENKKQAVQVREKYAERIRTLEARIQDLNRLTEQFREKYGRYQEYEVNPDYRPDKTPEELEAKYEAITIQMSVQLQDLELQLGKAGRNLDKAKAELFKMQNKYQISPEDWRNTTFDEKEELHQELLLEDKRKKCKIKECLWNEEDKQIGILNSKITDKINTMKEQCGKEEPLAKEEIQTIDFDARRNQLEYHKKELLQEMYKVEKGLQSIRENLTAFAEYQDFEITQSVIWDEELRYMEAKRLREYAGMMRRDYRHEIEEQKRKKDKTESRLYLLVRKQAYQEDYYRKPLEAMLSVTQQAGLILAQIHTTLQSYDSQMAKLEVDISMVEKEKDKIEGLLEDYIKEVHRNMLKMDNNSTITVRERPIKMLRLQIPDWEENEGLYRQRLNDFMEELTRKGMEIYERNENPSEYFGTRITTRNLYDTIVGIGNIQIRLYKIEAQREYPITWAEVAKNSGGEGFLSAFVILSSLLYYMRRDEADIFADQNEGKVLVMDNPFAQTNAAHLLKPLMDMAKKTNTQLICLSGLGGDSIYSRFDNIYVLNLIAANLRGGMQYLRGDHMKGTEEEAMIAARIEVMEQQSLLF